MVGNVYHKELRVELREKLAILADAAKYDASCASSGSGKTRAGSQIGSTEGMGICHSYTPDGRMRFTTEDSADQLLHL